MAVHLRETNFNSTILLNSESWVNLSKTNIEDLESVDKMLICKFLETPTTTPSPALYLELGLIPLSFKIKARRIMFLHNILRRTVEEVRNKYRQM